MLFNLNEKTELQQKSTILEKENKIKWEVNPNSNK